MARYMLVARGPELLRLGSPFSGACIQRCTKPDKVAATPRTKQEGNAVHVVLFFRAACAGPQENGGVKAPMLPQ